MEQLQMRDTTTGITKTLQLVRAEKTLNSGFRHISGDGVEINYTKAFVLFKHMLMMK